MTTTYERRVAANPSGRRPRRFTRAACQLLFIVAATVVVLIGLWACGEVGAAWHAQPASTSGSNQ